MVYEAIGHPGLHQFWIVTGFPKGVVKFTWTARRVGRVHRAQGGFRAPHRSSSWACCSSGAGAAATIPRKAYASYVSEPPSDLSPGLAGALIDEKVDTKEVIATIVDLARRGYLEITDTRRRASSARPRPSSPARKPLDDLQGFEKKVADSLFDAGHPDQVTTKRTARTTSTPTWSPSSSRSTTR